MALGRPDRTVCIKMQLSTNLGGLTLRLASRSSNSLSLATVSTGFALPKGLACIPGQPPLGNQVASGTGTAACPKSQAGVQAGLSQARPRPFISRQQQGQKCMPQSCKRFRDVKHSLVLRNTRILAAAQQQQQLLLGLHAVEACIQDARAAGLVSSSRLACKSIKYNNRIC